MINEITAAVPKAYTVHSLSLILETSIDPAAMTITGF